VDEPRGVIIVGAGPQAKVAIDIFARSREHTVLGILDDDVSKTGSTVSTVQVLGTTAWGLEALPADVEFFVAIGGNAPRTRVAARLRDDRRRLANALHSSAVIASGVTIGINVLVCANAVVGVDTRLDDYAVVNTSASVDHESVVGEGAYLAPGVHTAGKTVIGREAFVGAGTIIGPGVTIGEAAIVGAGSLVLRDVPPRVIAWGRPAQVIRAVEGEVNWAALLGGAPHDSHSSA
jgi:sugar O-acyltransferase (sialic acid O-acetyltransferase NeuD family)